MGALIWFAWALALDCFGDVLSYTWAKNRITLKTLLVSAIPIYAVSWYCWSYCMKSGLEVWWTGTVWSLVGVISGVTVGAFFGETIAPKDWVGIALAVVAIILLTA
jgi:multidrug transporter EmrE-like cation transporter